MLTAPLRSLLCAALWQLRETMGTCVIVISAFAGSYPNFSRIENICAGERVYAETVPDMYKILYHRNGVNLSVILLPLCKKTMKLSGTGELRKKPRLHL